MRRQRVEAPGFSPAKREATTPGFSRGNSRSEECRWELGSGCDGVHRPEIQPRMGGDMIAQHVAAGGVLGKVVRVLEGVLLEN
jgi:hypothetical protein